MQTPLARDCTASLLYVALSRLNGLALKGAKQLPFLCESRSAAGLMLTDYRQFSQLTKDKRRNNIIFDKKNQMKPIIEKRKEDIRRICQELQIKRLYVFGSVVSDKFNDQSDIDFLITFLDNLSVDEYTNNYFSLHYQLRALFQSLLHRECE